MKVQDIPRGCGLCTRDGLRSVALHRLDDAGTPTVTEWGVLCECARGDAFAADVEAKRGRRPYQLSGWLAEQRSRAGFLDAFVDPTARQREAPDKRARLDAKVAASPRRESVAAMLRGLERRTAPPGPRRDYAEREERW